MARQFNLIPPICEQAEYHMFQREKVEVQLPELFHKIGGLPRRPRPFPPLPLAPPLLSPWLRPAPPLFPLAPPPLPLLRPLAPAPPPEPWA